MLWYLERYRGEEEEYPDQQEWVGVTGGKEGGLNWTWKRLVHVLVCCRLANTAQQEPIRMVLRTMSKRLANVCKYNAHGLVTAVNCIWYSRANEVS